MGLDVKVTINLSKPVGKVGSWFPLIYIAKGESDTDSYGEYKNLEEVLTDYEATTEAYKIANLIFMQNDAPSKIAICMGDTDAVTGLAPHMNKEWRQLITAAEFSADVAAAIEATQDKMYFTRFSTASALETAATAQTKALKEYDRTFAVVYPQPSDGAVYAEAAVVGATAGLTVGSFTYKNMIIKGVTPLTMTDTEISTIHKNGGITIVEKAGDTVTSEGIVTSGEYADIIDSKDYVIQNIAYKTQKVFNTNKKVPYTNLGISMLEAATLEVLVDAYNNGMIADNADGSPAYSTDFAPRSETTETDRATRKYPYGKFAFALSGAIHECVIEGEVTV